MKDQSKKIALGNISAYNCPLGASSYADASEEKESITIPNCATRAASACADAAEEKDVKGRHYVNEENPLNLSGEHRIDVANIPALPHRNAGDLRTKNLSDNYLFAKVMEDENLCRRVLEEILQVKIRNVVFINTEESVRILPESKGIRMDVYVNDEEGTIYNVEMQTGDYDNLPKRSRYYQGTIDLDLISAGQDYLKLKRTFVIFICTFPLFGMERHIYTFVNTCKEDKDLELGDETIKLFLSTCGKIDDISRDLKEFLHYVENTTDETAEESESRLVKDLHQRVREIKDTRKYQVEYMTLYMHEQDIERRALAKGRAEGRAEGREEGRAEGHAAGIKEGRLDVLRETACRMYSKGRDAADIADLLDISEEQVTAWIDKSQVSS